MLDTLRLPGVTETAIAPTVRNRINGAATARPQSPRHFNARGSGSTGRAFLHGGSSISDGKSRLASATKGRIPQLLVANLQFTRPNPVSEAGARAFVTLDGLRGIAALAIAARHAPFLWPAGYPTALLQRSYLAVDFFFVLSGFVLSYAYSNQFETGMTARQFMIARLVRVYPLYCFALLLSVAMAANLILSGKVDASVFAADALFGVFFLPSLARPLLFPLNNPAWSLFFELVANAAFGVLGKRLNGWTLAAILCPAAAILASAVWFGGLGFGTGSGAMDAGFEWRSVGAGLARVAYSFFAGVLVFRLWRFASPEWRASPLLLVAALFAILAACPPAKYQAAFDLTATLLVFPALVFLGAACKPGKRFARLFAWIGAISYGVYVLQAPVFNYARALAGAVGHDFGAVSLSWAAMSIALVVAVATAADDCIDRPVRAKLTEFFKRPRGLRRRPEPVVATLPPRSLSPGA